MKTSEILTKLAKYRQNNDYVGFKNLFNALNLDELTELQVFANELKNYCRNQISKHIK